MAGKLNVFFSLIKCSAVQFIHRKQVFLHSSHNQNIQNYFSNDS